MDGVVRLALESQRPVAQVAADLGVHPEALRKACASGAGRQGSAARAAEPRSARRFASCARRTTSLRRANEILKSASLFFAREVRPELAVEM